MTNKRRLGIDSRSISNRLKLCLALLSATLFSPTVQSGIVIEDGPALSVSFTPSTIGPGSVSTISYTIINTSGNPVTGISFTNTLPTIPGPMTVASPANASTTCSTTSSSVISAPDGGSTVSVTDLSLAAFSSCTVSVNVTASTPGVHTNPTVFLSSDVGSNSSAPVDLTVVTTLPSFSKSFAPSEVAVGERSTLTFTFDNSLNASLVGNLNFTDNLPNGMIIADPANASTDCVLDLAPNTTMLADSGSSVFQLDARGSITPGLEVLAAGAICTAQVDIVATGPGALDNTTEEATALVQGSFRFRSLGKASDTLTVTRTNLALTKSFVDDPVAPGSNATLEFTLNNFDRNFSATNVAFSNDLTTIVPSLTGLTFDSLLANSCGGSISGVGTTSIGLSGGNIAAEGSCIIQVSLSVPIATIPGAYINTTSTLTGMVDGSPVVGNMASETLFVESNPQLTMEFLDATTMDPNPVINSGEDIIIRYTISNPSTTSGATDISFLDELTDSAGMIGFLPFPVTATLPPNPNPPCGAGSSLSLSFIDTNRQGLSLTDGSLTAAPNAGSTCSFDVTVTVPEGVGAGLKTSVTEAPTATIDGETRTGVAASDMFTVVSAPSLNVSFIDNPVVPGSTGTMEFTLVHPGDSIGAATGVSFSTNLSADITPALAGLTADPFVGEPCGAGSSVALSAGDTLVTLTDGILNPGESCTFSVTTNVSAGSATGTYTITTSEVSATVDGLATTALPASGQLIVGSLIFSKEFLTNPVLPGESLVLRFNLENVNTSAATGISFTDNLIPVARLVATDPALSDDCGGTLTVTPASASSVLNYTGGSLAAGASCTIDVEVTVPLTTSNGAYENFVNGVSYMIDGTPAFNGPAVDNLVVDTNRLSVTKEFTENPTLDGTNASLLFTITNPDTANTATDISFTDNLENVIPGLQVDSLQAPSDCLAGGATIAGLNSPIFSVSTLTLNPGASCTILANVAVPAGTVAGTYTNTTSEINGLIGGLPATGSAAQDDLEVVNLDVGFTKSFSTTPATPGSTTTLTFEITNNSVSTALQSAGFTDDLDAVISGMVATGLPLTNVCGAGSTLSGTSTITLSGANLVANGGSCSFDVDIIVPPSATPDTYTNTTSDLSESGLQAAAPAQDDLEVVAFNVDFTKSFSAAPTIPGSTTTLTFNITNNTVSVALQSAGFTDDLNAVIPGMEATGLPLTNVCGVGSTLSGTSTITLSGANLASDGGNCSFDVDILVPPSATPNTYTNTTSDLTESGQPAAAPAVANLVVNPVPPIFSKSFTPDSVPTNVVSTLLFTIDNTGSTLDATALDFTDNLPAGLLVASPANAGATCTGGTLTAVSGTAVVSYTGGTASAAGTCTVSVDTISATGGMFINTSGDLTSSLGNSGTASATLAVDDDIDNDGITNDVDNCPMTPNADQADGDEDNIGDVCDDDLDNDLVLNEVDNCPLDSNMDQADLDMDTIGDVCDDDIDNDTFPNASDNCPMIANSDQADLDLDTLGNACDDDDDGDQLPDDFEIENGLDPLNSLDQQGDPDGDGFTNLEEFEFGTDPNSPDADENENGIPDSVELLRMRAFLPSIYLLLLEDVAP